MHHFHQLDLSYEAKFIILMAISFRLDVGKHAQVAYVLNQNKNA